MSMENNTYKKYRFLASNWHKNTMVMDTPHTAKSVDKYQLLVAMGKDIAPYIMEDIKNNIGGNFWFQTDLLAEITGEEIWETLAEKD
jgi:hypothetical protein